MMNRAEVGSGICGRIPTYQLGAFRGIQAWIFEESGTQPCDGIHGAAWNPLNTTLKMPGSTLYGSNSAGVQNYVSFVQGMSATLATLHNGNYQGILDALIKPNVSAKEVCDAIVASPWGTTADLYKALDGYQNARPYFNGLPFGV